MYCFSICILFYRKSYKNELRFRFTLFTSTEKMGGSPRDIIKMDMETNGCFWQLVLWFAQCCPLVLWILCCFDPNFCWLSGHLLSNSGKELLYNLDAMLRWKIMRALKYNDCKMTKKNGHRVVWLQHPLFPLLQTLQYLGKYLKLQWWPIETDRQKRFLLCTSNHWDYENKQCTIKKPYKIATRNEKKFFEMFKICLF